MGQDDQSLKKAIEASLSDFVLDEPDPLGIEQTVREGGR